MRELMIWCLLLLVVSTGVQSSVMYRKYRELEIPSENIQANEEVREVVEELRKEVGPVEVEIIEPMVVVKEEVLVPTDTVRSLEVNVESEEPAPINPIQQEVIPENSPDANEVKPIDEISLKSQKIETESIQESVKEATANEADTNEENVEPSVKQNSNTTFRPTIFQQAQQVLTNNPLGQFIDSIRRPLTSTRAPGEVAVASAESSTIPNLLQQFQASVQNLGNQITSAFIPPNQNADSTQRPPNLLESLQSNIQNAVNSVFRPPGEPLANPPPAGPLQQVISNVQGFFTGNRNEVASAEQPTKPATTITPNNPVDDKVDNNLKTSEEVKESSENTEQLIVIGDADDSAE